MCLSVLSTVCLRLLSSEEECPRSTMLFTYISFPNYGIPTNCHRPALHLALKLGTLSQKNYDAGCFGMNQIELVFPKTFRHLRTVAFFLQSILCMGMNPGSLVLHRFLEISRFVNSILDRSTDAKTFRFSLAQSEPLAAFLVPS